MFLKTFTFFLIFDKYIFFCFDIENIMYSYGLNLYILSIQYNNLKFIIDLIVKLDYYLNQSKHS